MDFLPNRFKVSLITQENDNQEIEFFDAAKNGYADLIALYLEENPKLLRTTDSNGWTALQYAIKNSHVEVVTLLLKISTNIKEIHVNDVLEFMHSCVKGSDGRVKFLLKNAMNIKELNHDDIVEFMQLVQDNHVGTVRLLIQINKKLLEMTDAYRQTGLMHAAVYSSAEMLELFINDEVDLERRDDFNLGKTLLRCAVENDNLPAVRLLLKKNANTEARDLLGNTVLMAAAQAGMANIVEVLILHGANIEARDFAGKTVLTTASEKGETEVVALLIQYGANVNAIWYGIRTFQNGLMVIQSGDNIDATHRQILSTVLICASIKGQIKIVQLLLENGADASIVDCCGMSAGVYAVRNGHMELLDLFLQKGMDLSEIDENGKTPIMNSLDNNTGKIFTSIAYRLLLEMSFEQQKSFIRHSKENKAIRLEFCIKARYYFIQLKKNLMPFYKHEAAHESDFSQLPSDLLYYIKALELYFQLQHFPDWYHSYAKKYISTLPSKPILYQEIKPVKNDNDILPTVTFVYESKKNQSGDHLKEDSQPDQNIGTDLNDLVYTLSNIKLN